MRTDELPLTLDKRGLAKYLGISRRSIERLRAAGTFPQALPGFRRPRWSTAVVVEWLRSNGLRTSGAAGGSSNSEVADHE
jgi:predicted DNA-binding transcriptional regulator AlpA